MPPHVPLHLYTCARSHCRACVCTCVCVWCRYVIFTDGDITYERCGGLAHCVELLLGLRDWSGEVGAGGAGGTRSPPELVMQNDGLRDDMSDGWGLCAGFMAARATPATLAAFTVDESVLTAGWDDQRHLNRIRDRLQVAALPLELFPNGQYWTRHKERLARARPGPYLVHSSSISPCSSASTSPGATMLSSRITLVGLPRTRIAFFAGSCFGSAFGASLCCITAVRSPVF